MADDNFDISKIPEPLYRENVTYDIDEERKKLAQRAEDDGKTSEIGDVTYSERFEQAQKITPDFNVVISTQAREAQLQASIAQEQSKEITQNLLESQQLSTNRQRNFYDITTSAEQYTQNIQQRQEAQEQFVQQSIEFNNQAAFNAPELQDEITYQQAAIEPQQSYRPEQLESYIINSTLASNQPQATAAPAEGQSLPVREPNELTPAEPELSPENRTTSIVNNKETTGETAVEDNSLAIQNRSSDAAIRNQQIERNERYAPPPTRDTPEEAQQVEEEIVTRTEEKQAVVEENNQNAEQSYLEKLRAESDAIIARYQSGNVFE